VRPNALSEVDQSRMRKVGDTIQHRGLLLTVLDPMWNLLVGTSSKSPNETYLLNPNEIN
jgi:hypothetical protein